MQESSIRLHQPDRPRILVSLACYNERDTIGPLVAEIRKYLPEADILITEDNSPDGTGAIADEIASRDPKVRVNHRSGKLGLGTAILSAMQTAIRERYDLFLNMDADFSHPPRYLPAILAGMADHDVMIGSRYVPGGGTVDWPWKRRWISRSVNWFTRFFLRIPAKDASGAYRCYRVEKLREVNLDAVRSRGYSFQQEVLFRCHRAGCTIGETPIIFEDRKTGLSKVSLTESVRSLSMLGWLGVRNTLGLERGKAA